jgi:hypothetical protein
MDAPSRQQELEQIIEEAINNDPALREALSIFQIGQIQYTRALAGMSTIEILSSDTTNPVREEDAVLGEHDTRD